MQRHADNAREIMRVIKAAQAALRSRFLQHLHPHRLTVAQYQTLQHLHWHASSGGLTIGELSGHLGLANSTVSGIVDRLERDGWVQRSRSDADRRKVKVMLGEKAMALFRQTPVDAEHFWQTTIGRLDEHEQTVLMSSLKKLKEVMEQPTWPTYEEIHARLGKEQVQEMLEEIFSDELGGIGRCLLVAREAELEGHEEIARRLREVALEEIEHARVVARLLGRDSGAKRGLAALAQEVREAETAKLDAADRVTAKEVLDFLNRAAEEERRHGARFEAWTSEL